LQAAKKYAKIGFSCGGHFLLRDLWLLLAVLVGTLCAAVNVAAYFNGHGALVDDYEFTPLNLKGSPHSGIAPVNQRTGYGIDLHQTLWYT
jgi:hypothetical protein